MKKLFLLFTLLCSIYLFSQKFYEMKWKLVAENYQKGLFKSNLPIILEIQKEATKDGNTAELIRGLKAEFSIINQTRDDTQNNTASEFFSKISGINSTLKGEDQLIFQVLKGEFISDYYNQNYWRINERTNVLTQTLSKEENLIEIETWSKLDFKNYLSKNFEDVSKKRSDLSKISLSKYEKIFENTDDIRYFPTLLDWNSINEINFLKNSNFFTKNELKENNAKILTIYNDLISKNSGNPKLYFLHQKLNYNCGFKNCKDKLEQLEKLVEDESIKGDYKVLMVANIMNLLIAKENYKLALTWANDAKEMYPKSEFLNNTKNLENQILTPSLQIHFEQTTLPDQPIHIEANAKNATEFSLAIYEVKDDFQNFLNYARNSYDKKLFPLVKKQLVREEKYTLPKFSDYKNHQTALEIKPLPAGIYMVEYKIEGEKVEDHYFIVSQTRIITEKDNSYNKKENVMKLVDRNTGKIFANKDLVFYKFNNGKSITKSTSKTDNSGNFNYPRSSENEYYNFYLVEQPSTKNFEVVNFYKDRYYDDEESKNKYKAQIFIDRGIYRPGQIVYFKVINTKLINDKESVANGISQEITLYDANGDEVSNQKFTTNEFGSYNGSFTLPSGKLNGQFYFEVDSEKEDINESKYFQVEEYKRPKFEVTFEPIKEEYKYGQTIELKGNAKMFSGVALSNSIVNYEIKKQNIRWRYFSWYPRGNDNENSILGDVKTDEKGDFIIKLKLEKDETLDGIQIDNYQVNASVTDINGETQSANTDVKVASVSHYITIENTSTSLSKTDYFTDEKIELKVSTKNYNDQNLKRSYHAKLSLLKPEERIYRDNFKNQIQDSPIFSKAEFVQKFPHDHFNKDEQEDKIEKVIFDKIEESKSKVSDNLDLGKLPAGKYQLELYNIEGKDSIKTEKTFEIFDKRSLLDSQKPFLRSIAEKMEYKRSETGKIYVYSAIPDALVNVFVQNGDGETATEQKKLKNGILIYEAKFSKDEKVNSLNIQFQLVAFNDVQTETIRLNITEETKDLRIETVTFRDKLEPNVKEKWTVKVLGANSEKVQAELLANMYDRSLDQFASNNFSWGKLKNSSNYFHTYSISEGLEQKSYQKSYKYLDNKGVEIPNFNWFNGNLSMSHMLQGKAPGVLSSGNPESSGTITIRGFSNVNSSEQPLVVIDGVISSIPELNKVNPSVVENQSILKDERATSLYGSRGANGVIVVQTKGGGKNGADLSKIEVRQNLNETAFFYPNLITDKDGNVSFEFTSPEALTQWKVMFLAHTKDARSAYLEKSVITQKEFSVTPNYPRFLREGDELNLQSKLSSLVDKPLGGVAQLQILDAFTNEDISSKFNLNETQRSFQLKENGNSVVNWTLKVPNNVSSIIIKVVATSTSLSGTGNFSDGEQKAIAVLPNRMLVTEAVPIFVKEGQTKTFSIENLTKNNSTTVENFSNTLELTTDPIWEIMFALPSLKNDPNNSADVVFNKWFADVLASEIFKANPKLKMVFEEYQSKGLLRSNLEKNQELKQLLLEETPWILESKNEEEQMQKLARLFDANTMKNSINDDWSELQKLQNSDGGFSWYSGYPSSYSTSLYILKSLGKINVWLKGNVTEYQSSAQKEMVSKLVKYVDSEIDTSASLSGTNKKDVLNNYVLDYLDTRNYWEKEYPLNAKGKTLKNTVIAKAKTEKITDFTFFGLHRLALLFNDYGMKDISKKFLTYLKETSTETETQGTYWKQNLNDWGWFSSKVVNQAGALEAFNKLTPNDQKLIEKLKIWLVTQKEVNSWGSSRGTAEVIFTFLNSGRSWTSAESDKATIIWGSSPQSSPKERVQNATGYYKKTIKSDVLDKTLGTVTITKLGAGIVQGGLFWQYYEDLDKIRSSESYISITKELYKKVKTVNGEELQKITENSPLKIGDKVTVRMILNTDRAMEFIQIKDMRAAGFEPLNVISGYEWKNNLGYYQSTKDASTNFYIQYMPKGKYVFEYDHICNAAGKFSNGITTLQNYYAPQMNAHTQGTKVEIKE